MSPSQLHVRTAERTDLPRLTEIYNHYIIHTPITFDVEPYTTERRAAWFDQFASTGRHRLLVAETGGRVVGYAGTTRFRPKAAYETTVETTIYCCHETVGQGVGAVLYQALFEAIADQDVHRIVAGYTLPNPASAALHQRFGFQRIGIFSSVGRKFGRFWDVAWNERPVHPPAPAEQMGIADGGEPGSTG